MPLRLKLRFFSLLLFELVTVTELDEISLARRLLAGDADAFEPFVNLFHSKLFQFTYMTCGQREDAEEVVQETLLKVFQNLHQLREPEHIRAWVFRIARNVCSLKHRKSVFAPTQELSLDETSTGASSWAGGAFQYPTRSSFLKYHGIGQYSENETMTFTRILRLSG